MTYNMLEAFEHYVATKTLLSLEKYASGSYKYSSTQQAWETWQAAQAEQSVPVVGDALFYASDSTPTAESQIQYDVCAYQKDYSFFQVYRKPATSITTAELERLRKDAEQVQFPSCTTCANRGRVNGLSQETYCDWCLWQGQGYRVSHYAPQPPKKEPRHE